MSAVNELRRDSLIYRSVTYPGEAFISFASAKVDEARDLLRESGIRTTGVWRHFYVEDTPKIVAVLRLNGFTVEVEE